MRVQKDDMTKAKLRLLLRLLSEINLECFPSEVKSRNASGSRVLEKIKDAKEALNNASGKELASLVD